MTNRLAAFALGLLTLGCSSVFAQAPAPSAQGAAPVSSAVANPTYVTILMEIDVNRPAADVWKRVGKYCDIGEWFRLNCTITSGKDGEVGAVRSVANEVLVGKTELSYTYTQPVTATTSKLIYTLMYDNSMLADDAAREQDKERRRTQFMGALQNMKVLAEGGTLPPAPPRGGGPGRGGAPGGAPAGGPPAGAPGRGN